MYIFRTNYHLPNNILFYLIFYFIKESITIYNMKQSIHHKTMTSLGRSMFQMEFIILDRSNEELCLDHNLNPSRVFRVFKLTNHICVRSPINKGPKHILGITLKLYYTMPTFEEKWKLTQRHLYFVPLILHLTPPKRLQRTKTPLYQASHSETTILE